MFQIYNPHNNAKVGNDSTNAITGVNYTVLLPKKRATSIKEKAKDTNSPSNMLRKLATFQSRVNIYCTCRELLDTVKFFLLDYCCQHLLTKYMLTTGRFFNMQRPYHAETCEPKC